MKSLAIMQPTFLPWIGYFALMDRVDEFVFLDSVQFARRSWQQRNRVKTATGPLMITVPVRSKGLRDQLIRDVRVDHASGFADSTLRTLSANYSRAPHFLRYKDVVFDVLASRHELLADMTEELTLALRDAFGIRTPCLRSRDLAANGAKGDLLAAICKERGADTYVSPPGSRDYLDGTDTFQRAGISLLYHEYDHPSYPQLWGPFEPFMSAVDLLFNVGPESLSILRSGVREAAR